MKFTGDQEMNENEAVTLVASSRNEVMADFARRLYKARTALGWKQADLARRAQVLRDSISSYEAMKALPSAHNLAKLARALNCKPSDLMPSVIETPASPRAASGFTYRVSAANPKLAFVQLNRWVSSAAALKIATILEDEPDAVNGD